MTLESLAAGCGVWLVDRDGDAARAALDAFADALAGFAVHDDAGCGTPGS